jgi:hypothetical protein
MVTAKGGDGYWNTHPDDDTIAIVDELIPSRQRKRLGVAPNQMGVMGTAMGDYGPSLSPKGTRASCRRSRRLVPQSGRLMRRRRPPTRRPSQLATSSCMLPHSRECLCELRQEWTIRSAITPKPLTGVRVHVGPPIRTFCYQALAVALLIPRAILKTRCGFQVLCCRNRARYFSEN